MGGRVMSDLSKKVQTSIDRLRVFCPEEGYYLAFSGGKDSVVCKKLLEMSGCKFDAHYRITSVDPPELYRFIKEQHPDVAMERPRYQDGKPITMWNLIKKKLMPPTRLVRYCCQELKEDGGDGRMVVTGVRWAESSKRKNTHGIVDIHKKYNGEDGWKDNGIGSTILVNDNNENRRMMESCYQRNKTTVNPIIDWTDGDVWEFIHSYNVPYCSLYDDGFSRLGCIGCPFARRKLREVEFRRWPKYKAMYIRAFDEMLKERQRKGKDTKWETGVDVFNWWMEYDILPGQMEMEDFLSEDDDE